MYQLYIQIFFKKKKKKWKCPITTVQIFKGRQRRESTSSRGPEGKSPQKGTIAGKPGGGVSIGFRGFTQQEQRHRGGTMRLCMEVVGRDVAGEVGLSHAIERPEFILQTIFEQRNSTTRIVIHDVYLGIFGPLLISYGNFNI